MKAELTAPKAKFNEACSWDQGKTSTLIVHITLRNRSLAFFCNILPCGGPEFRSKSKLHRKANEEQEKALHMDCIFVLALRYCHGKGTCSLWISIPKPKHTPFLQEGQKVGLKVAVGDIQALLQRDNCKVIKRGFLMVGGTGNGNKLLC